MSANSTPPAAVRPLRRAAIMVGDLDQSLTLYRDVLGLAVWKQGQGAGNATFFRLLGTGATEARFAILQSDSSETGMVGLFEVRNPAPPALQRAGTGINRGEVALVFPTSNVETIATEVALLGLTVICPPTRFAIPTGGFAREMTFRDFDGALINLIEPLPD